MTQHRANAPAAVCLATAFLLTTALPAACGIVQNFSGPPGGTVAAGEEPGGGSAPGTLWPGFVLSVTNNGGGPNSLLVFDSTCPTGGDDDLGTPNEAFGGKGIGAGGGPGPGQNSQDLGNLLIVAEDIIDGEPDGLVDEPDDEAGGGVITFMFDEKINLERVVLVDIDLDESARLTLYNGAVLLGTVNATPLGNNSVQTLDGTVYGLVDRCDVELSSSGAVAEIEFTDPTPVPTERSTWGGIKSLYYE